MYLKINSRQRKKENKKAEAETKKAKSKKKKLEKEEIQSAIKGSKYSLLKNKDDLLDDQ